MRSWPIAALEMASIAVALHTFGEQLHGRAIRLHSDSMNAVHNMSRQAPQSQLNMRLLRGIHAVAWTHDIRITLTTHIAGKRNVFADAASRLSEQEAAHLQELGLVHQLRQPPAVPGWLELAAQAASLPVGNDSSSCINNSSSSSQEARDDAHEQRQQHRGVVDDAIHVTEPHQPRHRR